MVGADGVKKPNISQLCAPSYGVVTNCCVVPLMGGGVWAQALGADLCLLNLAVLTVIGTKCKYQEGGTRTRQGEAISSVRCKNQEQAASAGSEM